MKNDAPKTSGATSHTKSAETLATASPTFLQRWVIGHPVVWTLQGLSVLYTCVLFGTIIPAAMLMTYALLIGVPLGFVYFLMRRPSAKQKLDVVGIHLMMSIAVIVYSSMLIGIAKDRAIPVVEALDRYKVQHGSYPETLEALVPTYLQAIPETMPVMVPVAFRLRVDSGQVFLIFDTSGAFNAEAFDLEKKIWMSWS